MQPWKTKNQEHKLYTLVDTVDAIKEMASDLFVSTNTIFCLNTLGINPAKLPKDIRNRVFFLEIINRLPKPNSNGARYGETALIAILNNGSIQKRKATLKDNTITFSGYRSEGPSDLFFNRDIDFSKDVFVVLEFTELLKYECNQMQCIALILNSNIVKLFNLLLEKNFSNTIIISDELQASKTFNKKKNQIEQKFKENGIKYKYEILPPSVL